MEETIEEHLTLAGMAVDFNTISTHNSQLQFQTKELLSPECFKDGRIQTGTRQQPNKFYRFQTKTTYARISNTKVNLSHQISAARLTKFSTLLRSLRPPISIPIPTPIISITIIPSSLPTLSTRLLRRPLGASHLGRHIAIPRRRHFV